MKKKLFLIVAMAFALCLMLSFSVFAEDEVPASGRLGTNTIIEGIALPTVIDKESQIEMSDGLIYPSFYFFKDQTTTAWDFSKVQNEDKTNKYTLDNIVKLEIPHGITNLANLDYRDEGRTTLTHVRIPNTINSNNWDGGFRTTSSLVSVEWEEGYSHIIFGSMFYGCPVANFVIPEGVTKIEAESLCQMGLTSITIPDNVTYIGSNAFSGNQQLKEVIISPTSQLKEIANSGFAGLHGLTEPFYFPSTLEKLGASAFSSSYNISAFLNLENTKLTTINEGTFYEGYIFTSISLPSTLTSIGSKAFNKCTALQTVTINGNQLTSIGNNAFDSCSKLASINVPSSIKTYGNGAFAGCSSLAEIALPNGLTTIGSFAFRGTAITSAVVPDSVTSFGTDVFNACSKLTSATFPAHFTSIPYYTFYNCSSLESFYMSDNVTYIGQFAFFNCSKLGPVYLSKNIETIYANGTGRQGAFQNCSSMYFVNNPGDTEKPDVYILPSTLVNLGGATFKNCTNINTTLVFPKNMLNLDDDGWNFGNKNQSTTRNFVFLGEYSELKFANENYNTNFYFVNPNVTTETLTLTMVQAPSKCYAYVCSEGKVTALGAAPAWTTEGYAHITDPNGTKETPATCTMPKMVADYCFCGTLIEGSEATEGDALGHNLGEAYYIFTTLTEKGKTCKDCLRCGEFTEETEHENAILTDIGYSVMTFETGNGIASFDNGYTIDNELLAIYEATKGTTVTFGVAFNAYDGFDFDGTLDSFKVKSDIVASSDADFGAFAYKVIYSDASRFDSLIVIGVYARENEALTFINADNGVFAPVSYNSVLNSVQ